MGVATLAAKKTTRTVKADPDEIVILSIKCRREWRDWANAIAKAERAALATLIDQLLAERARERELPEPPSRGKE